MTPYNPTMLVAGELKERLGRDLAAAEVVVLSIADLQQALGDEPARILAWLQWALPDGTIVERQPDGRGVVLWRDRLACEAAPRARPCGSVPLGSTL